MDSKFDHVKDSGERREFFTGAVRDMAKGKGFYFCLPPYAIDRLAKHYEHGARKYGVANYLKGIPLSAFLDSGLRHAFRVLDGQKDEDHVSAVIWNFMSYMVISKMIEDGKLPKELDDLGHVFLKESEDVGNK